MNSFLRAQFKYFSNSAISKLVPSGISMLCSIVAFLALLLPARSIGAIGFSGATLSPATQLVCSGGSATITLNPTTCSLAGVLDWSANYVVDSSNNAGVTWSAVATGTVTAASPTVVYTTPVLTSTACYTLTYRIRLTGIIQPCIPGNVNFNSTNVSVNVCPNPAAIACNTPVCFGDSITLCSATPGGLWSSGTPGTMAVVNPITGRITPASLTGGTATISYTVAGCSATTTVTAYPTPAAIGGATNVCQGSTTLFTNATLGGTWSSNNTAIATVGAATGVVTGVTGASTTTITYTLAPGGCFTTKAISVNPLPSAISGGLTACVGTTTTLSSTPTGGNWISQIPFVATVGISSGVVTGVNAGSTNITYSLPVTGCRTIAVVTVSLTPAPITGTLSLCRFATTTLSTTTPGGVWVSLNTSAATVNPTTGVVTGVTADTATIVYSLASGCVTSVVVTVNAAPTAIFGPSTVCLGQSASFGSTPGGGTWSSSVPATGTIGITTGSFVALGVGTTSLTYTLPGSCVISTTVTVSPLPNPITGTAVICQGQITTMSSTTPGGTWTSSNAGVATIDTFTGSVNGISPGAVLITYSLPTGCATTAFVTVNPLPAPITGPGSVCVGNTVLLSTTTTGGTWSSSIPPIGSIGSSTGLFSGSIQGFTVVTYIITATGCQVSRVMTVNPNPFPIDGTLTVCVGSITVLTNSSPGGPGTWSSSNSAVAPINTSTGVITGTSAGTATIVFTLPTGCRVDTTVTVNPLPAPITGFASTCIGFCTPLSSATVGGAWSSSDPTVATVNPSTGLVCGLTAGTTYISYTLSTGCFTLVLATVDPVPPPPTGVLSICVGGTTTLSHVTPGGTWQSSDTIVAKVFLGTGLVTGFTAGTANITYTTAAGCTSFTTVTVNPVPPATTGTLYMCAGNSTTLSNLFPGGAWTSTNTVVATVSSTGLVNGLSAGTSIISYTLPSGCAALTTVTVYPLPAILGSVLVCPGIASTLTGSPAGGLWVSASSTIATIGSLSGSVIGVNPGTTTITYTLATTCRSTAIVTVQPLPALITGPTSVCQGSTITLLNFTTGGGTWSSSNFAVATIDAGGLLTGVSGGTTTITFTANTTGCVITTTITVNPLPGAIGGPSVLCVGSTVTLTTSSTGGSWSSSGSVATIGSSTGVVTGVSDGTEIITYTLPTGCFTLYTVTVNPLPSGISGALVVCNGFTITLSSATAGGTWSIAPTTVATIDTVGVVTGQSAGTAVVTYTLPTGCVTTAVITVNPLPAPITGLLNICVNDSVTLFNTVVGGSWSTENIYIAVIDPATGLLASVSAGTVTVSYTLPTGCYTTAVMTINPIVQPITGPLTACVGASVTLANVTTGGSWSSSNLSIATIGSATGVVTGIAPGTTIITYRLPSSCPRLVVFTVNPLPASITGALTICRGDTSVLASATPGGTWSSSNPGVAFIFMPTGQMIGITAGTSIITYMLPTGCLTASTAVINPLPTATSVTGTRTVCVGSISFLGNTTFPGGSWSSQNPLIATISAGPGSGGGVLTGIAAGTTTITYTLPTGCDTTFTVTVNPLPLAITGVASVCAGATTTLSNATPGGSWTSSNPTVGTINSTTGVFTGLVPGNTVVSYVITGTGCQVNIIMTVNPNPAPINGVTELCNGTSGILWTTSTGGGWGSSSGFVTSVTAFSAAFDSAVVTALNVGVDTIIYTLPTGCSTRTIVTVRALPTPITGPDRVCVNDSVTLISGPTAGTWTHTSPAIAALGATTGVVRGLSAGVDTITYSITYTVVVCRTTRTITVNPLPGNITFSSPGVCVGSTVTAANTTAGGTWTTLDTAIVTINPTTGVITGVSAGTARITYTLATGCFVVRSINCNPKPNVTIVTIPSIICKYSSTTLTAAGAGIGGTYAWAPPTGLSGTVGATVVASPTITTTYVVTGTTVFGCSDTAIVTVVVDSLLNDISITGQDSICKGDCTVLIANGREGTFFNWRPSTGLSCTICDTVTACPINTTTYNALAIDSLGCRDSLFFTVTVMPLPVMRVLPNPAIVCNGSTAQLRVTDSFATAGYVTRFAWFPNAFISCDTCANPIVSNTTNLVYRVTGITPFGCFDSLKVPVTVLDSAFNGINKDTVICIGGSAQLNATSFNPDGSRSDFYWLNATAMNNRFIRNPIVSPVVTTTYPVIITPNVCWPDTLYTTVVVVPFPDITITPPSATVASGTQVPLVATINNEMIITAYAWSNPTTLSCEVCYNTIATPTATTTYTFTATSIYGCTSTRTVTITVGCDEAQIFIPNTFTPNGDGMNDRFFINGKGISRITKFLIYNRWGELVYERNNIGANDPSVGWDGQYKGVVLPPDVFYYFVEAECNLGETFKYKGDVSIVR